MVIHARGMMDAPDAHAASRRPARRRILLTVTNEHARAKADFAKPSSARPDDYFFLSFFFLLEKWGKRGRKSGEGGWRLIDLEKPADGSAVELCISRRLLQSRSSPRKLVLKVDKDNRASSFVGFCDFPTAEERIKFVEHPQADRAYLNRKV